MSKWLRWWSDTSNDPKLAIIAKAAGTGRASVVAVWAAVLERANVGNVRGTADSLPADEIAITLDLESEDVTAILDAMRARGMIDGLRVTAWEKRQPERERWETTSTERVRRYRERNTMKHNETPCNAMERHETPPEAEAEAEAEAEKSVGSSSPPAGAAATATKPKRTMKPADDAAWLASLKSEPAYQGIDIERELSKCRTYFTMKGITVSRQRFLNWLNRAERTITAPASARLDSNPNDDPEWTMRYFEGGRCWVRGVEIDPDTMRPVPDGQTRRYPYASDPPRPRKEP